ncbi:uncharacterized protein [Chironomus tepperi]|uniref:uncharacterized protein n=1 Tax=Chironomus tepperi TaxID=113505 RepID=UPI00391FCA10
MSLIVNFDNGENYYTNDTVTGHIEVALKKETNVKVLFLKIKGIFSDPIFKGRTKYHLRDIYLNEKIVVLENVNLKTQNGKYQYKFEFKLPQDLPQSINSLMFGCKVKYYCEAVVEFVSGTMTKGRKYFNVKRIDDLNNFPISNQAVMRTSKCTATSPPVKLLVYLPNFGSAVGKEIHIKIRFYQAEMIKIKKIKFALEEWQELYYYNRNILTKKTKIFKDHKKLVKFDPIAEIEHKLAIPNDMRISDILYSKMYRIKHFLQVSARIQGKDLTVVVPIIIGSVPFTTDDQMNVMKNKDKHLRHYNYILKDTSSGCSWFEGCTQIYSCT